MSRSVATLLLGFTLLISISSAQVSTSASPQTVIEQPSKPEDPVTLTGAAKRRYNALLQIVRDIESAEVKSGNDDERKALYNEFLSKSDSLLSEHPNLLDLWAWRAKCALSLLRSGDGRRAGRQIIRLGGDDSTEPMVLSVLATLERKGWTGEKQPITPAPTFESLRRSDSLRNSRPRPKLFGSNPPRSNLGLVGVSAEFSQYGAYLQRMIEAVQTSWQSLISESQIPIPNESSAVIIFRLNDKGNVVSIIQVTGDTTDQGKQLAAFAISRPSPYGTWNDDMKTVLGESQDMTFQFYYRHSETVGLQPNTNFNSPPPEPSKLDAKPTPVSQAKAVYPAAMRSTNVVGEVLVEFTVTLSGMVVNPFVIRSTQEEFKAAAIAAVSQWTFRPGLRDGKPASIQMQVPIVFDPRDEP